jgi:2-dehydro-3-deoxyphosphooctonate aldolase (KDO 8-P synthase)
MRSFAIMKQNGFPTVIFDATHAVQLPGAAGGKQRRPARIRAPARLGRPGGGADGLFIETHPDPAKAISDGPNMIATKDLPDLIERALAVWRAVHR